MTANVGFADRQPPQDLRGLQPVRKPSAQDVTEEPGNEPMDRPTGPPSYGIDAPLMVGAFALVTLAFVVVAAIVGTGQGAAAALGPALAAVLCGLGLYGLVHTSRSGKHKVWVARLDSLELRGTERALDIGCGRGLVTVALAERLDRGSVVGVDIWRRRDLTGNTRANAEQNLVRAGVDDRVEIVDADATDLPFEDGEFDVVTAGSSLHHLAVAAGRRDAMMELMRVTRPGGRIVIVDTGKTSEFVAWLRHAEWDDVRHGRPLFSCYPPVRTVTATKPRGGKGRAKK